MTRLCFYCEQPLKNPNALFCSTKCYGRFKSQCYLTKKTKFNTERGEIIKRILDGGYIDTQDRLKTRPDALKPYPERDNNVKTNDNLKGGQNGN